jgi:hypothetical protein
MIEDKTLDIKVFESDEESFWFDCKKKAQDTINDIPNIIKKLEQERMLNEAISEMCEIKLAQFNKS